jgi:hypothetical protein
MRVPNAGQDLIERRIVREGKIIAAAMLADYPDTPDLSLNGLVRLIGTWGGQLRDALRGAALKH